MMVVGLSGGIGAGKSTVADIFHHLGVPIIDADVIAREVVEPGKPALKAIENKFGKNVLLADGTINRESLKKIIFADKEKRLWLESLLHPLIFQEMIEQTKKLCAPYCIHVIPLLVETLPNKTLNRILLVDVNPETQEQRVKHRDNLLESHIKDIMASQVSREIRLEKADDIIYNHKDLDYLKAQVLTLHEKYLNLAKAFS